MANISVSLPADGTTIDVSDYNTPVNTIVNEINGRLDNSNIAAAAAIAGTKLADSSISTVKLAATSVTAPKIDFASYGVLHATGSTTVSIVAPAAGFVYVEFTKIYFSTPGTPTAGNATIDLPAATTSIYSISPTGGNLGSATYATTLVASRKFSVAAAGTFSITTSGGSGAGVIATNIIATFSRF
jgi:hypothetical protein